MKMIVVALKPEFRIQKNTSELHLTRLSLIIVLQNANYMCNCNFVHVYFALILHIYSNLTQFVAS